MCVSAGWKDTAASLTFYLLTQRRILLLQCFTLSRPIVGIFHVSMTDNAADFHTAVPNIFSYITKKKPFISEMRKKIPNSPLLKCPKQKGDHTGTFFFLPAQISPIHGVKLCQHRQTIGSSSTDVGKFYLIYPGLYQLPHSVFIFRGKRLAQRARHHNEKADISNNLSWIQLEIHERKMNKQLSIYTWNTLEMYNESASPSFFLIAKHKDSQIDR